MKTIRRLLLAGSCVLMLSTLVFSNDPAKEFSITKNPNGIWSYGYTTSLGGPFILITDTWVNRWNPLAVGDVFGSQGSGDFERIA
jgi:hypothetical protein